MAGKIPWEATHYVYTALLAYTCIRFAHRSQTWALIPGEIYGISCKRRVGQDKVQWLRLALGQRRLRADSKSGKLAKQVAILPKHGLGTVSVATLG